MYVGEITRVGQARALDSSCKLSKVGKASGYGGGAGEQEEARQGGELLMQRRRIF
jgi:hypothetical protein